MINEMINLSKPIYVEFCVLELFKELMYNFHYGFIKSKYGNKAKLLFMDTDSLCYEIKMRDFYQDIYDDKSFLILSI